MDTLSESASPLQAAAEPNTIATAPGDLPLSEIEARLATQQTQFRHDNTIAPLAPRPDEQVEVFATAGTGVHIERACIFYTTDGSQPTTTARRVPMEATTIEWAPLPGYLTRWRGYIPPQPNAAVVRYRIGGWSAVTRDDEDAPPDLWANDGQGFWFRSPGESGVTTFAYTVESADTALPAWANDAVIYQIFLDRFHPDTPDGCFPTTTKPHNRHGGTLEGVRQALPYLQDLGVTCLWLSPIAPSETYYRYDATDYYNVDPDLGGNDALHALTREAHECGMRVMLDVVPSHCSWSHPAFVAARRDPSAPTASWFTFEEWPDRYRTFLRMVPSLPSFNTDDPGARAYIIASAVQWLREYGVDAFRLDHAIGPSMDFWVAFRTATRTATPDVFTVGEVTDTPDCLRRYRQRLDAVLDFPLARALRLTFATGAWDVSQLDAFLTAYDRYMADGPGRVSFLDNHDMDRFLFVAGGDVERLKLAALCQFTLNGPPTIYYGTEVGLSQEHDIAAAGFGGDAEARRDMPWDRRAWDHDLLAFYRALIHLRRDKLATRRGVRRTVHLDAAVGAYAYVCSLAAEANTAKADESDVDVLVVFNLSEAERTIPLPSNDGLYTCLLSTGAPPQPRAAESRTAVAIAPRTGAILITRASALN